MLALMNRMSKTILVCSLLFSAAAAAQDVSATPDGGEAKPLWEWRIAAFARYGPSYPASKEMQVNFVPLPIPIYRGRYLRLFEDSENPIRGKVFERDRIKLDLDFDITFPADSDEIDARSGMPDLDFLVQAGPELDLQFARQEFLQGRWHLALQGRGAASFDGLDPSYRGLTFSAEFRYIAQVSSRDEFKFRITPTVATQEYMAYYYQVDPEFATPDRPEYKASGGYLGTDFTLNWSRDFTDKLSAWFGARLGVHSGARNKNSPLFTEEINPSVYAAFMYKFWESKRRAQRPPPES
jgi:outer membrane scaffolding protein for murein synthesis (MipA/OmpV family)